MDNQSERALAFVISQIGSLGDAVRTRADDVFNFIIEPALQEFGLQALRSDHDPTPGQVTSRIIQSILRSRVVIADLTGQNPNVYYELGVVHSFQLPVVILVDSTKNLTFDTRNERVIPIGDSGDIVGARQADASKKRLSETLKLVLSETYVPTNLVTEVATAQSLAKLAPDNPIASELSSIRQKMDLLQAILQSTHGYTQRDQYRLEPTGAGFRLNRYAVLVPPMQGFGSTTFPISSYVYQAAGGPWMIQSDPLPIGTPEFVAAAVTDGQKIHFVREGQHRTICEEHAADELKPAHDSGTPICPGCEKIVTSD